MTQRKEPTVSDVLDTKEDASERRARAAKSQVTRPQQVSAPAAGTSGFVWFVFLLTITALAGMAYVLLQMQDAQKTIIEQRARIVQLENKFVISGDNANQSLASVSAQIVGLSQQSKVAISEIDKLWAARNVNKKDISDLGISLKKSADKLNDSEKALPELKKNIASLQKNSTAHEKNYSELKKQLTAGKTAAKALQQSVNIIASESLPPLQNNMKSTAQTLLEQELLVQSLRERVSQQQTKLSDLSNKLQQQSKVTDIASLQKQLKNVEQSLKSIDAFRLTVNRDLLQLKQRK